MENNLLMMLSNIEAEEMMFLQNILANASEQQQKQFIMLYQTRRKDPQVILICTLLGFVVLAGVQRFMLGQIGMGLVYLFTGGLCLIGTIIDLVNYKSMTLTYNKSVAYQCFELSKQN